MSCKCMCTIVQQAVYEQLHLDFSGFGDSSSVMFCGSFHARAMYLPSQRQHDSRTIRARGLLRMTAPGNQLVLGIHELDRSICQGLAELIAGHFGFDRIAYLTA